MTGIPDIIANNLTWWVEVDYSPPKLFKKGHYKYVIGNDLVGVVKKGRAGSLDEVATLLHETMRSL